MSEIDASVDGLKEFWAKLDQISRDVTGSPMGAAMGKATLVVARSARKNTPVDRGPLRASIVPSVVIRDKGVNGAVGSNLEYAPFVEFDTKAHLAPWEPLFQWAMRKVKGDRKRAGALAMGTWLKIAGRGTKGKKMLRNALVDNAKRIFKIIGNTVGKIVRK